MKNIFNVTLTKKIGAALTLSLIMLLLASGAGYLGTSQLSGSLDFVTGPAWDTADGAMEGSIFLHKQML